ncbi:MAG: PEP-CTERM sorting domain-containing protein [Desulfobacteraceae bacterium]|nr:PEP-CTERM sorting domain-containing protein [Desulfobacteraceae bacterium]
MSVQLNTKNGKFKTLKISVFLTVCFIFGISSPGFALNIVLNDMLGTMTTTQAAAFDTAAGIWESLFSDDVTVRIDVGFESLGSGIIGSTYSAKEDAAYTDIYNALVADSSSTDDTTAVSNLQTDSLTTIINDPADINTEYLVDGQHVVNNNLYVTRANLKALGLLADDGSSDAEIKFSTNFAFDFDNTDGINNDEMDFIGVAAHEIGHALGFVSGVDIMDIISSPDGHYKDIYDISAVANSNLFSVLDLYRYSEQSVSADALDWGVGGDSYFSIDGGTTNNALLSTGSYNGDGRQASHWKDNLGMGLMDPTTGYGELSVISDLDIQGFDVIGWDTAASPAVPEPGTVVLMCTGILGLLLCNRRRKRVLN